MLLRLRAGLLGQVAAQLAPRALAPLLHALHQVLDVLLGGHAVRGDTVAVARAGRGAAHEQERHDLLVVVGTRQVQRGVLQLPRRVDGGAVRQQLQHHGLVPAVARPVQRAVAVGLARVGVRAALQQVRHHLELRGGGGGDQRRGARLHPRVDLHAEAQRVVHARHVALLRRREDVHGLRLGGPAAVHGVRLTVRVHGIGARHGCCC
mmetsp:Transcript_22595/g.55800  ORF Transcript_22595/g.55800 Transcript_22595/m.55800 type:complete len:207 (+) Transcript_22595:383-1003(+)